MSVPSIPLASLGSSGIQVSRLVDDPDMQRLTADRGVAIVASYTLAGGVLTGKYDHDPGAGRAAGMLE